MPCRDNPITEPSCAETAVGTYLVTLVHLVAGEPVKCSALSLQSRVQLRGTFATSHFKIAALLKWFRNISSLSQDSLSKKRKIEGRV